LIAAFCAAIPDGCRRLGSVLLFFVFFRRKFVESGLDVI
jgi:hypothetical protein